MIFFAIKVTDILRAAREKLPQDSLQQDKLLAATKKGAKKLKEVSTGVRHSLFAAVATS
jgi:hypothetical protein